MHRLFLICPDCHLESPIRNHFSGEAHFLTALGTVFDPIDLPQAEAINQLVLNQNVSEICVVNTTTNRFLSRIVEGGKSYGTRAESVLLNLAETHQDKLRGETSAQKRKLAELNISRQFDVLRDTPFLGDKIRNGEVQLKGYIYDREKDRFEEMAIRQTQMAY